MQPIIASWQTEYWQLQLREDHQLTLLARETLQASPIISTHGLRTGDIKAAAKISTFTAQWTERGIRIIFHEQKHAYRFKNFEEALALCNRRDYPYEHVFIGDAERDQGFLPQRDKDSAVYVSADKIVVWDLQTLTNRPFAKPKLAPIDAVIPLKADLIAVMSQTTCYFFRADCDEPCAAFSQCTVPPLSCNGEFFLISNGLLHYLSQAFPYITLRTEQSQHLYLDLASSDGTLWGWTEQSLFLIQQHQREARRFKSIYQVKQIEQNQLEVLTDEGLFVIEKNSIGPTESTPPKTEGIVLLSSHSLSLADRVFLPLNEKIFTYLEPYLSPLNKLLYFHEQKKLPVQKYRFTDFPSVIAWNLDDSLIALSKNVEDECRTVKALLQHYHQTADQKEAHSLKEAIRSKVTELFHHLLAEKQPEYALALLEQTKEILTEQEDLKHQSLLKTFCYRYRQKRLHAIASRFSDPQQELTPSWSESLIPTAFIDPMYRPQPLSAVGYTLEEDDIIPLIAYGNRLFNGHTGDCIKWTSGSIVTILTLSPERFLILTEHGALFYGTVKNLNASKINYFSLCKGYYTDRPKTFLVSALDERYVVVGNRAYRYIFVIDVIEDTLVYTLTLDEHSCQFIEKKSADTFIVWEHRGQRYECCWKANHVTKTNYNTKIQAVAIQPKHGEFTSDSMYQLGLRNSEPTSIVPFGDDSLAIISTSQELVVVDIRSKETLFSSQYVDNVIAINRFQLLVTQGSRFRVLEKKYSLDQLQTLASMASYLLRNNHFPIYVDLAALLLLEYRKGKHWTHLLSFIAEMPLSEFRKANCDFTLTITLNRQLVAHILQHRPKGIPWETALLQKLRAQEELGLIEGACQTLSTLLDAGNVSELTYRSLLERQRHYFTKQCQEISSLHKSNQALTEALKQMGQISAANLNLLQHLMELPAPTLPTPERCLLPSLNALSGMVLEQAEKLYDRLHLLNKESNTLVQKDLVADFQKLLAVSCRAEPDFSLQLIAYLREHWQLPPSTFQVEEMEALCRTDQEHHLRQLVKKLNDASLNQIETSPFLSPPWISYERTRPQQLVEPCEIPKSNLHLTDPTITSSCVLLSNRAVFGYLDGTVKFVTLEPLHIDHEVHLKQGKPIKLTMINHEAVACLYETGALAMITPKTTQLIDKTFPLDAELIANHSCSLLVRMGRSETIIARQWTNDTIRVLHHYFTLLKQTQQPAHLPFYELNMFYNSHAHWEKLIDLHRFYSVQNAPFSYAINILQGRFDLDFPHELFFYVDELKRLGSSLAKEHLSLKQMYEHALQLLHTNHDLLCALSKEH